MGKTQKSVREFTTIAFTLLGVLFGMMIMTFVFGQLGSTDILPDDTFTVTNYSQAWLNQSGYYVLGNAESNFSNGFVITQIWASYNQSGTPAGFNISVPTANYTYTDTGFLRNATVTTYSNVSWSGTYNIKTATELTSDGIQNNSIQGIVSYTNQSGTQLNTTAIAITLVILITVFLLFWNVFMKKKNKNSGGNFA